MRYLSVCSGIEAATVAWHGLGWEPAAFSEIERFPSDVLKYHYPNVPNVGDMTRYKEWNIGSIGLLVGGTPCQSFSVAGLRKGLDDPRGNLALVYCGLLDHFRPRWFVWENVPGVLSSNGGRDFGSFLGAVAELGYGFSYRVLDAQYWGVAQRRKRVFVVGYLGDWRPAAAVLFESKSLSRDTKPSREKGEETSRCLTRGSSQRYDAESETMIPMAYRKSKRAQTNQDDETWVGDGAANTLSVFDSGDTRTTHAVVQPIPLNSMTFGRENEKNTRQCLGIGSPGDPAPTLSKAHSHAVMQSMAVRRLTPVECERLQGFPDNYTNIKENCPDGPRYKAMGNSMAVPVMRWIGKRIDLFSKTK